MSASDIESTVTLVFSLDLETDPLGATLSVGVPGAPSEDARQALLDGVERALVGAEGNLVYQSIQTAHDQLEAYASRADYDVASIRESLGEVAVARSQTSITVEWAWEHEAASFMEFGTSDHTVSGTPLLVFEFDPQRYPYLAEMFPGGTAFLPETHPAGLPESRFVRDSLNWLRREVGQ
jgi:hypothetical protein